MQDNDNLNEAPASEVPEIPDAAMQAITEKIDEVFSKGDNDIAGQLSTEKEEVPAREVARRQSVQKEQAEELDEEGLTGADDPEGHGKPEETPKEGEDAEEGEPADDKDGQTAEAPTLDPNLRFVAQQFGWSDEKIDKLLKADPELAQDTFTNLSDAYTNLSRQMLPQGDSQGLPGTQPGSMTAQQQATTSPLDTLLSDKALAQFAEANGEEIVEKFLKPFAQERQALKAELSEMKAYVEVQQRRAVATEATTVLEKLSGQFADLYGKDTLQLSDPQKQARTNLAGIADQLRAGAKSQGRELSVSEALNRAHLIVSAGHRQQAVRKQVTEQVQRRSKQISAKPTQRRNPTTAGGRSDAAAIEAYNRKAAELGLEV
jgi:hypothetical protein